jgi:hypothetical protein
LFPIIGCFGATPEYSPLGFREDTIHNYLEFVGTWVVFGNERTKCIQFPLAKTRDLFYESEAS